MAQLYAMVVSDYPDGTDGKGYYFQPTIFTNASNEMRIAQEEILVQC